ncbi:MAG TPA: PfkB family carbohydrate kinase [Vicinamibacteria bacterium]
MKAWDAIGIGLVVRDVTVLLDHYPKPDEKMRARELHESGGGPVPTALVTLARLGRKTAVSGTVGDDAVGRFLLEGLVQENVDVSAVSVRPDFVSPTSVILVEGGRRTILEPPRGVDFPLDWSDVRKLPLEDSSALLVDARVVEVQTKAARIVREAGGLVVLDCGHPREGVDDLIAESDIAIFAHTYPAALHGEAVDVREFLAEVHARLPRSGPAVAGVTLGSRGCATLSRDEGYVELAAPTVEALDTTGAGDVFHGAFLHAFLKTGSVESSARFANVAGARKCEGMTGRAPIPPEEEIWRSARR